MVLPSPRTYNWVSRSQMLTPKGKTDPEKTVDVIIEGNTYFDSSNPPYAIKHGKLHEDDAIKKYILSEKAHHSNLKAL